MQAHTKAVYWAVIWATYTLFMSIMIVLMLIDGNLYGAAISGLFTSYVLVVSGLMRKAIGWTLAWTLFWIGHFVSRSTVTPAWVDRLPQWWSDFFYSIYNRLMIASSDIQDWGGVAPGVGPWGPVIKGEE